MLEKLKLWKRKLKLRELRFLVEPILLYGDWMGALIIVVMGGIGVLIIVICKDVQLC